MTRHEKDQTSTGTRALVRDSRVDLGEGLYSAHWTVGCDAPGDGVLGRRLGPPGPRDETLRCTDYLLPPGEGGTRGAGVPKRDSDVGSGSPEKTPSVRNFHPLSRSGSPLYPKPTRNSSSFLRSFPAHPTPVSGSVRPPRRPGRKPLVSPVWVSASRRPYLLPYVPVAVSGPRSRSNVGSGLYASGT